MTKAKFKVSVDMVDAAYYGVDGDLSWDEMKDVIQLAADHWLQTKGGGYVSLGDYNNVCESYALLTEDYGSLCVKYKDLESDYYAVSDELVEIKDELYKRGIKL